MFLILTASLTSQSQCSPNISNIYLFNFNGNNYEIVKENLNWVNASACAVARGGKLAEINSLTEQDSIFFHVNNAGIVAANTVAPDGGGASYLWLGGNDLTTEGNWVWNGDNNGTSIQFWQGTSSGIPVGGLYNNWGNEPDNWSGQDGLGFAYTNWPLGLAGQWNDVKETNLLYYIIEYSNTTSIPEVKTIPVSVYPNPTINIINVKLDESLLGSFYNVYDNTGKLMLTGEINSDNTTVDMSNLSSGIYLFRLRDNLNYSFKVMKE